MFHAGLYKTTTATHLCQFVKKIMSILNQSNNKGCFLGALAVLFLD